MANNESQLLINTYYYLLSVSSSTKIKITIYELRITPIETPNVILLYF